MIASRAHLLLTGDGTLTKKALADFQHSQRICPGIMAVAPGSLMQEIAEYSLQWPLMLLNYYRYTGDRFFTYTMVDKGLAPLFDYFGRYRGEDGLLMGIDEKWVLVDWPANLRDGYDYEYAKTRENAVVNAFYYASLQAAADLRRMLDRDAEPYEKAATEVREAYQRLLLDPETGLFVDAPGSEHSSLHANALPLAFGLAPPETVPRIIELIREKRLSCGVYIAPFVIEACYRAGEPDLAYDLLTSQDEHSWHEMLKHGATTCMEAWGPDQKWNTSWCHPWSSSPVYLLAEQVMGVSPQRPGWRAIRFAPHIPDSVDRMELTVPIAPGELAVRYEKDSGFTLFAPFGVPVHATVPEGVSLEVIESVEHGLGTLDENQIDVLRANEWDRWVGDEVGVWVSVDEQVVRLVRGNEIVWQAPCSTAAKGTGFRKDSLQTPLGWHSIVKKTGDGAPWGQVFRGGEPTGEVWAPGDDAAEDLVLTRILFLDGEEPGRNKGGAVDTFERLVYIHGTNGEQHIGSPVSHGCVRLRNDDVVAAFERIPLGARVLITEVARRQS